MTLKYHSFSLYVQVFLFSLFLKKSLNDTSTNLFYVFNLVHHITLNEKLCLNSSKCEPIDDVSIFLI